jgi:hypothetical protein
LACFLRWQLFLESPSRLFTLACVNWCIAPGIQIGSVLEEDSLVVAQHDEKAGYQARQYCGCRPSRKTPARGSIAIARASVD